MSSATMTVATVLGGHLLHLIVIGGALALAAAVYAVGTITAPHAIPEQTDERPARSVASGALKSAARPPRAARPIALAGPSLATAQQLAFLGLCAAAATHLAVLPSHLEQSWLYGAFFAVVAPLQAVLGWRVLRRPRRAELTAALTFSLAVVLLWALTRFIGLPIGPDHGATEELGVLDIFATLGELVSAAALLHALRSPELRDAGPPMPVWRWSSWGPAMRIALIATAAAVPLLSAFASRS